MYVCNVLRYRKYVRLANVPCTGSLINYITVVLSCLGTFECARSPYTPYSLQSMLSLNSTDSHLRERGGKIMRARHKVAS